ncbi:hypothetical protein GGF50DRAFT_36931, partial [Schizophyllum commune]
LRKRHPNLRLHINWVPGHWDIEGNERADVLAKRAAETGESSQLPSRLRCLQDLPASASAIRQAYK